MQVNDLMICDILKAEIPARIHAKSNFHDRKTARNLE